MEYISFDTEVINIDYILKLGVTKTVYGVVCEKYGDPYDFFAKMSALDSIVVTPSTHQIDIGDESTIEYEDKFWIHTSFGRIRCGISIKTPDEYSIISYRENDLMSHNRALRYGTVFKPNKGIQIKASLPEYGIRVMYSGGIQTEWHDLHDGLIEPFSDVILKHILKEIKVPSIDRIEKKEEEQVVSSEEKRFLSMLKQAEEYAILGSELEEKRIQEMGRISYREFRASDYDRTDRIAYTFIVDSVDKSIFKEGVQVEIDGSREDKLNGEIVEINDLDKENIEITVLFNKQVNYGRFLPFGWIGLSFSTINKDVQLDAIKKISTGSSKSKYMREVLGKNTTSGFLNNDLTETIGELQKKKYPPNNSQITAIERGINSKDVFLVMGPPGTGKTTVILEWVKYFVGVEHKRVLVSSQNNKAVDNVLARLAEEKNIDILRIGSEAKLQDEVVPYMFENKLTSLNDSINNSTEQIIDRLNVAISEWENYRNRILQFKSRTDRFSSIREQAKSNIRSQLIPIRLNQKSLWHEYNSKYAALLEKQEAYKLCQRRIDELSENDSSAKERYENKKKEISDDIGIRRSELSDLSEKYEELKKTYHIQKAQIRELYLKDMIKLEQESAIVESFDALPDKLDIAGLFSNIYYSEEFFKSEGGIRVFIKKIDNELQRARLILEAEKAWRDSVVGKQNYALNEILMESVDLVGATCIGINSQRRFANIDFDVTIIDEAGQIQIHNALVPMSVSNKLIMLGDHKQIPPSADQEMIDLCELNGVESDLLEMSLFEKMFVDLPDSNKMMLDTQYRMPGEIADIISGWFYGGGYKSPEFKYNLDGILPAISKKPFIIIDTSYEEKREEKRTPENGSYNEFEAEICVDIMKHIQKSGNSIDLGEIGIISAYKAQVNTIKSRLTKVIPNDKANAMVATLDSFQGQERDLIIYSFTKSSTKSRKKPRIGFLNELRRLNVAITRCKKTLILIGDMKFLSECMHIDIDEDGNQVYEKSEKQFSDFIKMMLSETRGGKGEILRYEDFIRRIG